MRGRAVQLQIAVEGSDTDAEALWEWLGHEPALRGRLTSTAAPAAPGTMGATSELVLQLAATAAGAGAVWAALAQSMSTWLSSRNSDVSVTLSTSDGRQVTVDAKRVRDAEALVRNLVLPEAAVPGEARGR
jgi:hypothetical protein